MDISPLADPKQVILKVLEIVDYPGDRETYTNGFIDLCEKQALLDSILSLPKEKQDEFKERMKALSDTKDQQQVAALLKEYISLEEYVLTLKNAS